MRSRWSVLAVALLTLSLACASHRAQPLRYAVVDQDVLIARDTSVDVQRLAKMRQTIGSDFVWFERNASEYVTTDAVIVALANRTMEPIRQASEKAGSNRYRHSGLFAATVVQQLSFVAPPNADPMSASSDWSSPAHSIEQMTDAARDQRALDDAELRAAKNTDREMVALLDEAIANGTAQRLH
ncbi:MAG: hypothetical protein ACXVIJ_06180 [Thermoanaerobaculia bacterium]